DCVGHVSDVGLSQSSDFLCHTSTRLQRPFSVYHTSFNTHMLAHTHTNKHTNTHTHTHKHTHTHTHTNTRTNIHKNTPILFGVHTPSVFPQGNVIFMCDFACHW